MDIHSFVEFNKTNKQREMRERERERERETERKTKKQTPIYKENTDG